MIISKTKIMETLNSFIDAVETAEMKNYVQGGIDMFWCADLINKETRSELLKRLWKGEENDG